MKKSLITAGPDHMTKKAAMPIGGEIPLKIFLLWNQYFEDQVTGMWHWGCGAYQVCTNDDPRLTLSCLTSRSI